MIRRFVMLRLKPEYLPELEVLGQRVLSLLRSRPMVADAEVAVHRLDLEPEHPGWDLVVTVRFADAAALEAYGRDEVHAAFVKDELAPRVAARSAFSLGALSLAG
jgi:hypothetical protein